MKLSIITINYNNLIGLQRTYDSVVCQTWTDYEWIVIDGGSTDGSRKFIEAHKENFVYWCSEPDKGVYNAMNKGIKRANGEYLNFMNSGDCYYDKNTLMNVFSQKIEADLVYGNWIRVYPDHKEYKAAPPKAFSATVFFENVCHQAMFIKSYMLKDKGYDENMKIYADWKRWIDMSLDGNSFQYIPYTICKYEALTGISEKENSIKTKEFHQLLEMMPHAIVKKYRKEKELATKLYEYHHNPIISDTIRIASNGPSYKTKLIHFCLMVIKYLEFLF